MWNTISDTSRGGRQCAHFKSCTLVGTSHRRTRRSPLSFFVHFPVLHLLIYLFILVFEKKALLNSGTENLPDIQNKVSLFMFEIPCIISLYYIKNQQDATLTVLFISNCKITLHIFGRFLRPSSGVHKTRNSHWCMSWVGVVYIQ